MTVIRLVTEMEGSLLATLVVQVAGNLENQMYFGSEEFDKKALELLHMEDSDPPTKLKEYFCKSVFAEVCFIYEAIPQLVGLLEKWQIHIIWSALWNYDENLRRLGLTTIEGRVWADRIHLLENK
jgi:hypothetical protein